MSLYPEDRIPWESYLALLAGEPNLQATITARLLAGHSVDEPLLFQEPWAVVALINIIQNTNLPMDQRRSLLSDVTGGKRILQMSYLKVLELVCATSPHEMAQILRMNSLANALESQTYNPDRPWIAHHLDQLSLNNAPSSHQSQHTISVTPSINDIASWCMQTGTHLGEMILHDAAMVMQDPPQNLPDAVHGSLSLYMSSLQLPLQVIHVMQKLLKTGKTLTKEDRVELRRIRNSSLMLQGINEYEMMHRDLGVPLPDALEAVQGGHIMNIVQIVHDDWIFRESSDEDAREMITKICNKVTRMMSDGILSSMWLNATSCNPDDVQNIMAKAAISEARKRWGEQSQIWERVLKRSITHGMDSQRILARKMKELSWQLERL